MQYYCKVCAEHGNVTSLRENQDSRWLAFCPKCEHYVDLRYGAWTRKALLAHISQQELHWWQLRVQLGD